MIKDFASLNRIKYRRWSAVYLADMHHLENSEDEEDRKVWQSFSNGDFSCQKYTKVSVRGQVYGGKCTGGKWYGGHLYLGGSIQGASVSGGSVFGGKCPGGSFWGEVFWEGSVLGGKCPRFQMFNAQKENLPHNLVAVYLETVRSYLEA